MKKFHSSTNKTSLFLVFILTAGTLTAFLPSSSLSMTDAYAIKDVEKEKVDCTNINLNLNGLNVNAIPETLRNALQAHVETEGAESGTSNFNGKDFSFVCLNNNDNEFIPQAPQEPQTPPTEPPCEVTVTNITEISRPLFFAHDPVNERMYVTGGQSVSVIDTDTNTLIDTGGDDTNGITPISIGFGTSGIAYDSFNKRMYVTNNFDIVNTVSVIDTTTNTLIDTDGDDTNGITRINVGVEPLDIAYDSFNKRMYVTNSAGVPGTVSVIDTTTNTEIDIDGDDTNGITRIIVGNDARDLAYDPINKHMYLTNFAANTVSVIDTTTNTVIDTIPVGERPLGIGYDSVNHRMYVANIFGDSVSVINLCPRPEL